MSDTPITEMPEFEWLDAPDRTQIGSVNHDKNGDPVSGWKGHYIHVDRYREAVEALEGLEAIYDRAANHGWPDDDDEPEWLNRHARAKAALAKAKELTDV